MKIICLLCVVFNVICCLGNNKDTVIIVQDSVNVIQNTSDWVLIYKTKRKVIEIFRIKNKDYSLELKYVNDYSNLENSYSIYFVQDLPTGQNQAIFFNKINHTFYISDWYDDGGGELLLFWTVNFTKFNVETIQTSINGCGKRKKINLLKLKDCSMPK